MVLKVDCFVLAFGVWAGQWLLAMRRVRDAPALKRFLASSKRLACSKRKVIPSVEVLQWSQ